MCQFPHGQAICLLVLDPDHQPFDPAMNGFFNGPVIAPKEHSHRFFEDHLESDCDFETGCPPEAFVTADMRTVKSQKKCDFLLGKACAFPAGAQIIWEAVICHGKRWLFHRAMKCIKIGAASKGGKPAKNGKMERTGCVPFHGIVHLKYPSKQAGVPKSRTFIDKSTCLSDRIVHEHSARPPLLGERFRQIFALCLPARRMRGGGCEGWNHRGQRRQKSRTDTPIQQGGVVCLCRRG
jgi:hypothetical protein